MKTTLCIISILVCQCFNFSVVIAAERPEKAKKRTPFDLYLTASEAYDFKQRLGEKAFLVDIRTTSEVMFVGIARDVDAHVPFELVDYSRWNPKKQQYAMKTNPDFVKLLQNRLDQKNLDKNATIILICRSGSRSAKAAGILHGIEYQMVYSVVDGFEGDTAKAGSKKGQRVVNGWKNAGLPWSYRVRKEQLYLGD